MATTFISTAVPHRSHPRGSLLVVWDRYWPFVAILAVTFALRASSFGDPVLELDEQLYLTIGGRLLHGALPYVDMWDRKPFGLFLIYALPNLFASSVVAYQVMAAGCVFATAAIIFALARRSCGRRGALVAALAYIATLNPLHGMGGQSPVIYNVFTAAAALATFKAFDTSDVRRLTRLALLAMAMSGIAIQCKYLPAIEGSYFGLAFLWRFRHVGMGASRIAATAIAMILTALAPTLGVIAWYAAIGHLDAMMQANLWSTFSRQRFPIETRLEQALFIALIGGPALIMAAVRLSSCLRDRAIRVSTEFWLATGWLVAAMIGFGILRDFYDFYFITVLPPLLLFVAPLADRAGRGGFAAAMLLVAYPFILRPPPPAALASEHRAEVDELVKAIKPYISNGRCLYVYDGPAILYHLTEACVPTRFIYPDHLNNPTEVPALGVDARAEEMRLLATHPGAIVYADRPVIPRVAASTRAVLLAVLKRDYVRVARVEIKEQRTFDVFALKTLHPGDGVLPAVPADPR